MTKINENSNKEQWLYKIGFFIILALPALILPPYFFPADWGKTIVFRSIVAILLFMLAFRLLSRKNELKLPDLKKNAIFWGLSALLGVFALATVFSVDPLSSLWGSPYRSGGIITFAFYFIFALLAFILCSKDDWKKIWIFSIGVGLFVSFVGLIQYFGIFSNVLNSTQSQPASTIGNPIQFAIYLLLLFFIALSLSIKEKNRNLKIFYIASLVIFIFTILITGTRAAYLGIVAGVLYFLLFYPKRMKILKTCLAIFLVGIFSVTLYANSNPQLPKFLQNRVITGAINSLSIKRALSDERFSEWKITFKEVLDKPVLGWGPENMSVGFDKNYDPTITPTPWWDRAHDIILDIGAQAGILGIVAYILLFFAIFWQTQRAKKNSADENKKIIITGIQAGLAGYLVSNLLSFDSSTTYLIFFLIIGYSLHLTDTAVNEKNLSAGKKVRGANAVMGVLFLLLVVFLWQYNLVPFFINAQINKATDLVARKECDQAFVIMDKVLPQHSFLDSYTIMQYVQLEQTCSSYYPQNTLAYVNKGITLLTQAVKIQPLYTRYWIWMGNLTTTLAEQETDSIKISTLAKQANYYFTKATELAPKHQEMLTGKAELDIATGDYNTSINDSKECIALNPNLGDCYFYLALAQIYSKDTTDASKNIILATSKGYGTDLEINLDRLINAYGYISDYKDLAPLFEKLLLNNASNVQYHSTLALIYLKLGEYDKAKEQAQSILYLTPGSTQSVDDILNSLTK